MILILKSFYDCHHLSAFKGGVTQKMTICRTFSHLSQVIKYVNWFVSSWEQILRIVALHELLSDGYCASEWVPSVRVKMADKKKHNNPQAIHMTLVHQLTFCEAKSGMFLSNKSIIMMI